MPESTPPQTEPPLASLLSERQRRRSQRAYIAMAVLLTVATLMLSPSSVLGVYFKQLGITADQLGKLVARASLVGLLGLLFSKHATKGRKGLMFWLSLIHI